MIGDKTLGSRIFNITNATIWSWIIFLYIVGWIIFSILGYLYKIVPFLWWTHKYSDRIGKEKVPTMGEMINEKAFSIGGITYQIGLIILVFSITFDQLWLTYIGGTVFLFGVLYTVHTLFSVWLTNTPHVTEQQPSLD